MPSTPGGTLRHSHALRSAKGAHRGSTQAALPWALFSFMRRERFLIADFDHLGEFKIPLGPGSCSASLCAAALCAAVCRLRVRMTGK